MKTRLKSTQIVWAAIVAMLAAIFGIANAEESSILEGATMSGNEISTWPEVPALANSAIAGSYKVPTMTDATNLNSGKKEFVLDWLGAQ